MNEQAKRQAAEARLDRAEALLERVGDRALDLLEAILDGRKRLALKVSDSATYGESELEFVVLEGPRPSAHIPAGTDTLDGEPMFPPTMWAARQVAAFIASSPLGAAFSVDRFDGESDGKRVLRLEITDREEVADIPAGTTAQDLGANPDPLVETGNCEECGADRFNGQDHDRDCSVGREEIREREAADPSQQYDGN